MDARLEGESRVWNGEDGDRAIDQDLVSDSKERVVIARYSEGVIGVNTVLDGVNKSLLGCTVSVELATEREADEGVVVFEETASTLVELLESMRHNGVVVVEIRHGMNTRGGVND